MRQNPPNIGGLPPPEIRYARCKRVEVDGSAVTIDRDHPGKDRFTVERRVAGRRRVAAQDDVNPAVSAGGEPDQTMRNEAAGLIREDDVA